MIDDERTPPRGGAEYSLVDIGEMAKRAADNSHETLRAQYELQGVVMRHDAQIADLLPLVKAAIVPQGRAIRIAGLVGAGALVVMALAVVAFVVRTPTASASVPATETARR